MNRPVGLRAERPVALTVGPAVSGLRTEMELRTGDRKRDANLSARVPLWPPGQHCFISIYELGGKWVVGTSG